MNMKKGMILITLLVFAGCLRTDEMKSTSSYQLSTRGHFCQEITASNQAHVSAGRAVAGGMMNMYALAKGSGDNLGFNNTYTQTTLIMDPIV